jgi:hypothetical protein
MMKKILILVLLLLSGCATHRSEYVAYDSGCPPMSGYCVQSVGVYQGYWISPSRDYYRPATAYWYYAPRDKMRERAAVMAHPPGTADKRPEKSTAPAQHRLQGSRPEKNTVSAQGRQREVRESRGENRR